MGILVACNASDNEHDATEFSTTSNEIESGMTKSDKENKPEIAESTGENQTPSNSEEYSETDKSNTAEENYTETHSTNKETVKNNDGHKNEIFTVTFKDYDGKVLKTQQVKKGESATAPDKPTRAGYKFIKWNTAFDNVQVNITTTAIYDEIISPTIIVEDVDCNAGDTIAVRVSALNNPGVLGMLINITYDENVMFMKKAENGSVMSEYMFTPPKNTKSGCNAAWYINDVPSESKDGDILILYFKVSKKAQKGSYPISVSCRGGAFDSEYKAVSFDIIDGTLNIK